MKTKYYACYMPDVRIEKVVARDETLFHVLIDDDWQSKIGGRKGYFDTFDDAKTYLMAEVKGQLAMFERMLVKTLSEMNFRVAWGGNDGQKDGFLMQMEQMQRRIAKASDDLERICGMHQEQET